MPIEKCNRNTEQGGAGNGLQTERGGVDQNAVIERIAEKARVVVKGRAVGADEAEPDENGERRRKERHR
ncbi:hypothetical protein D3C87_1905810 [compost metagenome]